MICELLLKKINKQIWIFLENNNNRIMLKRIQLYAESGQKIYALSHYMM